MQERWIPGVWLGKRSSTDEHGVGLENGKVVRTRSVRQLPKEDTWSNEELNKVIGQPWDPSITMTYEKLAQEKYPKLEEPGVVIQEEVLLKPQPFKIMEKDLKKAGGWTKGCRKCDAMRRNDPIRNQLTHSEECRKRVEAALAEDKDFQNKMNKSIERKEKYEEKARKAETGGATASGHQEERQEQKRGREEEGCGDEERTRRGEIADDLDIPMMDDSQQQSQQQPGAGVSQSGAGVSQSGGLGWNSPQDGRIGPTSAKDSRMIGPSSANDSRRGDRALVGQGDQEGSTRCL